MNKNLLYCILSLVFCIMIGGAVYEHIAVVPRWSEAPPASLTMFQGVYGVNPGPFWMILHPVILLLFIINLVLFWKTTRRQNILTPFITYAVILIITSVYFVPELMSITTTPFTDTPSADLTGRAKQWETLSLVRLGVLLIIAIQLMFGLTKEKA